MHLRCIPAVGICPHFRVAGGGRRRQEAGGRREEGGVRREAEQRREDGGRGEMEQLPQLETV
jgi:hypothetical protein